MEKNFRRVENIDELIKSVKLPYNAWKVLFLVDEEMDPPEMVRLLEEEETEVQQAIDRLLTEHLIEEVAPAAPAEEIKAEVPEEAAAEEEIPEISEEEGAIEEIAELPEEDIANEQETAEPLIEAEKTSAEEIKTENLEEQAPEMESTKDEAVEEAIAEIPTEEALEKIELPDESGPSAESEMEDLSQALESALTSPDETEAETLDIGIGEQEEAEKDESPAEAEEASEETVADKPPAVEESEISGKKKILIVDDSIVIRKMVEIALEGEELSLQSAVSGRDGLDKIDNIKPDLVILDLMLPDINGIDILKTVKASLAIPVIMLSGKDSPQMVEKAKSAGADAFLPKPFKDEDLKEKIKSLLNL